MNTIIARYHLHPIVDHFTIALCATGVLADTIAYLISATPGDANACARSFSVRLGKTAVVLLVAGAVSAIFSRFTGESEAERVWDSISPAAQQILFSDTGARSFLSHAVLGTYLMYALLAMAIWRLLLEMWSKIARTQASYLVLAIVVLCALLYQGKTGGELVYDHGVGTITTSAAQPQK
jgi:uncharacterized membrane protein